MKVTGFYLTKRGSVIDEKDVAKKTVQFAQTGVNTYIMCSVGNNVLPLLGEVIQAFDGVGIIAQASSVNPHVSDIILTTATSGFADKLQPLIVLLQDIAEPVSYGFGIKALMHRMTGETKKGNELLKDAIGGYVAIQFLPTIYDIIKSVRF